MSVSELFKDTRLPVLAAPLFIISYPELVIAQCKAGVIGSFPALNARPAEELEKWIIQISSELEKYKKESLAIGKYKGFSIINMVEVTNPSPAFYGVGGAPISSQDGASIRLEGSGAVQYQPL